MEKYKEFLESKENIDMPTGIDIPEDSINPMLFDFQKDITRWALKRGRAAIFADCGLGKTPMQLEWASHVPGNVLILAPLAVSQQTVREGKKFGIDVKYSRSNHEIITITNYEMLDHFDSDYFTGVVLDESSIIKNYSGKIRNELISKFANTPFRLACTATPAPNDYMELGNHSEFLGVMTRAEMLAMYFIHDGGETQKWRLKGHADDEFWKWLCSWAVMIRKPSDLGYCDKGFELPKLNIIPHVIETKKTAGQLFQQHAKTLSERIAARRDTIEDRVNACGDLINASDESWIMWCNLNNESAMLKKIINDSVEVKGSDSIDHKEKSLQGFTDGNIKKLVSKPSIAGFGLNWQHCHNMAVVGLSDSYEQFYQLVRRCWRFGQKEEVNCHIFTADIEGAVVKNIKRKERDANIMAENMVKHMSAYNTENIKGMERDKMEYKTKETIGQNYKTVLGDSVESLKKEPDDSIHYSIFSPPFASLYTYSNSERDMGNAKNNAEFFEHFKFLILELHRTIMPHRLVSVHCMNIPAMKERDGYIGIHDFRGDIIRAFQAAGFIYHSEVCIWKDPLIEATRTKALGLMHKQIQKDSSMCRQGLPDYLVTFRKAGDNPEPVGHPDGFDSFIGENEPKGGTYSHNVWRRYASPVWMDINQSKTLQYRAARDGKDERHICPLQLDVINRAIHLWTNKNDIVYSPFMGIGSEGVCAIEQGRRFIGHELKESYYNVATSNLKEAHQTTSDLFANAEAPICEK